MLAYPMHGQTKLSAEGYRTRDGHVIEWLGRLVGDVDVISRPEPIPTAFLPLRGLPPAAGTRSIRSVAHTIPLSSDRRRWWPRATPSYPRIPSSASSTPAIVWNPFTALAPEPRNPFHSGRVVLLDLLDDWTRHFAFATISREVERAYRAAFARADHVTANGEGTAALARRFGRDDVVLIPNGCDPDAFDPEPLAAGATVVGYVGKLGRRLDVDGVLATAAALPEVDFRFAGPILDPSWVAPLREMRNIALIGDVRYDRLAGLLQTFDVGWVPHRVGGGEVGGDVIKTYEYRAAGLPVLSTPIDGAGDRGVDGVHTASISAHAAIIGGWITDEGRVRRHPAQLPATVTWRNKTEILVRLLHDRTRKD
ncbi:hypothetical protein [Curtobacterium sp. MCSS17_015]|uniref:hypothetical protein n=1 Tax=Curtobacterium sp. MCSS17_015 TaxID=2175666 RepID=UPI001C645A33|nr:hypothetical protein [Curtobacterium sp. MCSS17_015]WIB26930.1 hypothetical protein DEJ18_02220 [Curtobacterium sp. MCSS17_015]